MTLNYFYCVTHRTDPNKLVNAPVFWPEMCIDVGLMLTFSDEKTS